MIKDPGELNEKVQVLAPTVSYGSNGEQLNTWGDYGTKYAKIEPLGGGELVQADILTPASRARFTLRYDSTYTENHRLVWNSQTWNILSITFEGRKTYIVMLAETNTSQTGDSTSYGNYYLTSSLKIRHIDGTDVDSLTPTQADITADVGLTAVLAGEGYIAMITVKDMNKMIQVASNGTYWFYSYVT